MTEYVHGYGTPEQERLVEQAEHWRHRLIADGTRLEPGTRLLEVGTGVGAVLAVLGQEFPGVALTGVDVEPKQLEYAREHLERAGVEATLVQADALALPFEDESFDHVWMMWFLEHVADPVAVLREARRVLVPGGGITGIEVDYGTVRVEPSTPAMEALFRAMVQGMAAAGWSDAGTRLPGWLREAGFRERRRGRADVLVARTRICRARRSTRPMWSRARSPPSSSCRAPTRRSCAKACRTCATCQVTPAQASGGPCTNRLPCASKKAACRECGYPHLRSGEGRIPAASVN